jgi:hypothetical protein
MTVKGVLGIVKNASSSSSFPFFQRASYYFYAMIKKNAFILSFWERPREILKTSLPNRALN